MYGVLHPEIVTSAPVKSSVDKAKSEEKETSFKQYLLKRAMSLRRKEQKLQANKNKEIYTQDQVEPSMHEKAEAEVETDAGIGQFEKYMKTTSVP
jgi:flagellar hook-basal body complex protein FliE